MKSRRLSGSHDTKTLGQIVAWKLCPWLLTYTAHPLRLVRLLLKGTSGLTIRAVAASLATLVAVPPHHHSCTLVNSFPDGAQHLLSDALFCNIDKIFRSPADTMIFSTSPTLLNQGSLKMHYFTSKDYVIFTALAEHSRYNLPLESELFTCQGRILLFCSIKSLPSSVGLKTLWLEYTFCGWLLNTLDFDLTCFDFVLLSSFLCTPGFIWCIVLFCLGTFLFPQLRMLFATEQMYVLCSLM